MISLFKRMAIIIVIVAAISTISSYFLIQKYRTIEVIVPVIVVVILAIVINFVYWHQKSYLFNRKQI